MVAAEGRIGRPLPGELKEFYLKIGYGFLGTRDKHGFNRIMPPVGIADFVRGEGSYQGAPNRDLYDDPYHLAFFEAAEGVFLTLAQEQQNDEGQCPVYYFDTRIADSPLGFIRKMIENIYYYLNL